MCNNIETFNYAVDLISNITYTKFMLALDKIVCRLAKEKREK